MTARLRMLALCAALFGALAPAPAAAESRREQIERRVAAAAALFEAEGLRAFCDAIADPSGSFLADDAYVFGRLRQGGLLCHPRPDLLEIPTGRPSGVPDMIRNTEAQPSGAWTRYDWPRPDTFEVRVKSTFCMISGPLMICAGDYFDVAATS